jgi:hypothetical protein
MLGIRSILEMKINNFNLSESELSKNCPWYHLASALILKNIMG